MRGVIPSCLAAALIFPPLAANAFSIASRSISRTCARSEVFSGGRKRLRATPAEASDGTVATPATVAANRGGAACGVACWADNRPRTRQSWAIQPATTLIVCTYSHNAVSGALGKSRLTMPNRWPPRAIGTHTKLVVHTA